MQDQDQLIGRESSGVFIKEEGQHGALGLPVLRCWGTWIARAAIHRVVGSHEEVSAPCGQAAHRVHARWVAAF